MFSPEITILLEKTFPALPQMLAASSLRHDIDEIVAMAHPPCHAAVIDDNDTASALGDAVTRALKTSYNVTRVSLGKSPAADMPTINLIRRKAKNADLLIAVGSGTISDLCKYASFLDQKPYITFPTAASMNGYLSANASITENGFKTTFPAHLPNAVFCDLSVITTAPSRLNKSGLGDSLARPTAQADWLLSHLLLGTPYTETPFQLTAPLESELFDRARGLALGDPTSVKLLLQTLLLSGLGMTHAGGSYPASQSEHMLAHAHEMLHPNIPATLHGEQIGVTTITAATRQEQLLLRTPTLLPLDFPNSLENLLPPAILNQAQQSYAQKCERIEAAGLSNDSVKTRWPDIAHRLQSIMLPAAKIQEILTQSQAPTRVENLGWSNIDYSATLSNARYLRDRFTCLDLE